MSGVCFYVPTANLTLVFMPSLSALVPGAERVGSFFTTEVTEYAELTQRFFYVPTANLTLIFMPGFSALVPGAERVGKFAVGDILKTMNTKYSVISQPNPPYQCSNNQT
jgi:hypothetical protein